MQDTRARSRSWTVGLARTGSAVAALLFVPGCLIDRTALSQRDASALPDITDLDAPGLDATRPDAPTVDASAHIDAFDPSAPDAPSDAGMDAPMERDAARPNVVFTLVQKAEAEGPNPTATFATAPVAGNLLVAIGFHRLDDASPEMSGWNRLLYDFYRTGPGDRRGLVVFWRVAAPDEPTAVRLAWTPSRECRLYVQELEASEPGGWSFEQAGVTNSANAEVTSLAVSTSDTPDGTLLVVGALGSRDDPGEVMFSMLENAETLGGVRTIASAFAAVPGGDPVSVTATWSMPKRTTLGIVAFRFAP